MHVLELDASSLKNAIKRHINHFPSIYKYQHNDFVMNEQQTFLVKKTTGARVKDNDFFVCNVL